MVSNPSTLASRSMRCSISDAYNTHQALPGNSKQHSKNEITYSFNQMLTPQTRFWWWMFFWTRNKLQVWAEVVRKLRCSLSVYDGCVLMYNLHSYATTSHFWECAWKWLSYLIWLWWRGMKLSPLSGSISDSTQREHITLPDSVELYENEIALKFNSWICSHSSLALFFFSLVDV